MMLMVPILSGTGGVSVGKISITLGIALAAIAAIIFTARTVVPSLLYQIVRLRSPELFIISVVLLSLGTSWLTSQVGLSLALGAFIAGLVLSESDYSHQIVADILPFRDVFNSIFFMSIGMLLSVSVLYADVLTVGAWVGALTIGKALIVFGVVRLLGYSLRISTMTALGLAQIGEFSFILAKTGLAQNILAEADYQRFLAASILSMIATPFFIKVAPRIGYALQSVFSSDSRLERSVEGFDPEGADLRDHVIIIGYGLNGRNLAKVLRRTGIPYVVLELNAEAVREAHQQGEPIVYGDATRKEVLNHVHLGQARVLVLAISDPAASRHTVSLARQMHPEIHIIVRTRYMTEMSDLRMLGANEVIPEEFETGIEIFSRVLRKLGIGRHAIQHQVDEIRSEGYEMLRSPSLPTIDFGKISEALSAASTETVQVESGAPAAGKSIAQLRWRTATGVSIIAIIKDGNADINPGPETVINEGDMVVLIGTPEKVDQAIESFLIKAE
jgi:CPA2 family monovalent cation:H+ antiporter-2